MSEVHSVGTDTLFQFYCNLIIMTLLNINAKKRSFTTPCMLTNK